MKLTVVIFCFNAEAFPCFKIGVLNRVELFGRKAEKPVPGRIGGNMGLVDLAYREKLFYVAVGTFHGVAIKFVIRAFVLVYKYAVFFERFMAVAVKLLCKSPSPGPNGSVDQLL